VKREAILDAFEASGLSGAAFARQWGLKYPTFANWLQRRRRERGKASARPGSPEPVRLLEAVVESEVTGGSGLEIEAPGGIKLRVRDRGQIALAAELLKSLSSC
jgi:hypothetical protein